MEEPKRIVVISDATGKTAKRLLDAVLAQYSTAQVDFSLDNIYKEIRTKGQIDAILDEIDEDTLVIFSLISEDLSAYMHLVLTSRGILHLNALEPMLSVMTKFLGFHPDYQPGLLHKIDDNYYHRIDAIGYTVEHDDGQGHLIGEADVVLLGLSRTCKTPISMYLACNHGLKAANIPIVADDLTIEQIKLRVLTVPHHIIYGLEMNPDVLMHVREERRAYLDGNSHIRSNLEEYHDPVKIRQEIRVARRLFADLNIETISVTRRAIEEISKEIVEKLGRLM